MASLVRQGVFETNSSSCHSFTTNNSNVLTTIIPPDGETIMITASGGYGWGRDEYDDPETKLDYLAVAYAQSPDELQDIIDVVKEHTGYNVELKFTPDDWSSVSGYIDHQSLGMLADVILDKELIKRFIFDPGWELIIDNDN